MALNHSAISAFNGVSGPVPTSGGVGRRPPKARARSEMCQMVFRLPPGH